MNFENIKNALVNAAQQEGLTEYEIYYKENESISVETLKKEISTFSSSVDGGICFRCIVNDNIGYASSRFLTEDGAKDLVHKAISNAKVIETDMKPFIYEGSKSYVKINPKVITLPSSSQIKEDVMSLSNTMYQVKETLDDSSQSFISGVRGSTHIFNSKGVDLSNHYSAAFCGLYTILRKGEEAEDKYTVQLDIDRNSFESLSKKAVQKCEERFGATIPKTGQYPIVLDHEVFADYLSTFSSIFSGKNAIQGLSLLKGKEGQKVAADIVNILDDPMPENSSMQASFDAEGVATSKKYIIKDGILQTLLYDISTADKAGVQSTGNAAKSSFSSPVSIAPYYLGLQPGKYTKEELFQKANNGIYITEAKGFHAGANPNTGDFSIESAGFMIRDGKIGEPIKSFTLSGNFYDLLLHIQGLSDTTEWEPSLSFTNFGSPNVLLPKMPISGQ